MAVTVGVLAYDIANTRRRTKVRRLLEGYGMPVQESVFLVALSATQWAALKRRLLALVERAEDDVRVWQMCALCRRQGQVWCGAPKELPGPAVIL